MTEQKLLFEPAIQVPNDVVVWLRVCDAVARTWEFRDEYYKVKQSILFSYAADAGYDLQTINKRCHTCGGTGIYNKATGESCWVCLNGVYQSVNVLLQRWVLNGELFYIPQAYTSLVKPINKIEGYVNIPAPNVNCIASLLSLYYIYGVNDQFCKLLNKIGKKFTMQERKRWGELSRQAKADGHTVQWVIDQFYNHPPVEDDLPF